MSVCEINHNPKNNSLEITQRFFLDDAELALNKVYGKKLDLLKNPDETEIHSYMKEYLGQRFTIRVNGKQVPVDFLGIEIEEDAIWCYLEVENVPSIEMVRVTNTALFETFEDQANLVHFSYNDVVKSVKLSRDEVSSEIDFTE